MLTQTAGPAPTFAAATPRPQTERLRLMLLWITGASGALVFIEPSPYEAISLLTIAVFAITGLTLQPTLLPLGVLLVLINIGYSISAGGLLDEPLILTWVLTSWYLAITALFFAAMLSANTEERLDTLVRGCIAAGVITSLTGLIGYFRLVPSELFLLNDRATGTFKDPNVFGAFLVFPALLALTRVITGNFAQAARGSALLALFAGAILLSFSRAAWGQVVFTAILVLTLTFVTCRSSALQLRIVILTVIGVAVMVLFIAALLSIDIVADLFKERASLTQSYDVGPTGRFGHYLPGILMALDSPFGIGPMQFAKFFNQDPHNTYLNAFAAGGWLGGVCYLALTLVTLIYGLRPVLSASPWQPTAIAAYAAYVGLVGESFIIDSDHWRHTFLLLGILWGLIAMHHRRAASA